MANPQTTVRLKVSPEVARLVGPEAPRPLQMDAARGALPLPPGELLVALLFFCHGGDAQLRGMALKTMKNFSAAALASVVTDPETHPQVLDFVARVRLRDPEIIRPLLAHPALPKTTVLKMAQIGDAALLHLLAGDPRLCGNKPEIIAAICANPNADRNLKLRLGWQEPSAVAAAEPGEEQSESEEEEPAEEELNLSKYQQALEMDVSAKIKMALTGDKEWRSIFIKDANKLVSGAVMKNPRITDGEVLTIAKSKGSNDEMIRLITLNRDWIKNYEIQKALVLHARTPLPKALRYMNVLTLKDIKSIAKSRGVAQAIVNNARRLLIAKEQKR